MGMMAKRCSDVSVIALIGERKEVRSLLNGSWKKGQTFGGGGSY